MKKLYTILGFIFLLSSAQIAFAAKVFQKDTGGTLTTSLVSYWKADNDATDFFGTNNGTLTGPNVPGFTNGILGQAFHTTSTNPGSNESSSVQIVNSSGLKTLSRTFSVSYWFNLDNTTDPGAGQNPSFICFGQSGWTSFYSVTGAKMGWGKCGVQIIDPQFAISANTSTFVTFTIDGSGNYTYYINGVSKETGNTAVTLGGTTDPTFMRDKSSPTISGWVDEIGVWSKVLSATEISDLYNGGVGDTMINSGGGVAAPKMTFSWITDD